MSTYLPELRAELSFGDVCEAEFLYDVHVREDAHSMGMRMSGETFAQKHWQLPGAAAMFIPALDPGEGETFALAHGTHHHALVLSDDCLIASALGRDGSGPKNRRLLLAPIVAASEEEVQELEGENFGRFPLPADEHFASHCIADLRRCFMADARDVHKALAAGDFRTRSVSDETAGALAIRWSAFTLRRGPFVAEDSLEKFAEHLLDTGRVAQEDDAVAAATLLADVVSAAWGYEGRGVEGAGNAADDGRAPDEVIAELTAELERLREATARALTGLGELGPRRELLPR